VTILDGVSSIGYRAFLHCASLTSITFPATVNSFKEEAFDGCDHLESVFYQGSQYNTKLMFRGCTALNTVCVAKDYAYSTFGRFCVTPNSQLCQQFQGLFNRCDAPYYTENSFVQQEKHSSLGETNKRMWHVRV